MNSNLLVAWVPKPVWVDDGRVEVAGRGDRHVASAEGRDEDGDNAGENRGVGGSGEGGGVAVCEVFEEWPVWRDLGETSLSGI